MIKNNCKIVKIDNIETSVDAIKQLISNKDLRNKIVNNGYDLYTIPPLESS